MAPREDGKAQQPNDYHLRHLKIRKQTKSTRVQCAMTSAEYWCNIQRTVVKFSPRSFGVTCSDVVCVIGIGQLTTHKAVRQDLQSSNCRDTGFIEFLCGISTTVFQRSRKTSRASSPLTNCQDVNKRITLHEKSTAACATLNYDHRFQQAIGRRPLIVTVSRSPEVGRTQKGDPLGDAVQLAGLMSNSGQQDKSFLLECGEPIVQRFVAGQKLTKNKRTFRFHGYQYRTGAQRSQKS